MKKKNTAKKAVLPALLAVLCSTAALTSVSYAWFTLGNTASVQGIDVNVEAADGMQISADAINWKSNMAVSDFAGKAKNVMPTESTKLMPVSTVGEYFATGDHKGEQKMFKGTVSDTSLTAVEDFTNFIAFDLYVKLDSEQPLSLVKDGSGVADSTTKNAHLASRVSFAYFGTKAASAPSEALADLDVEDNGVKIWEPNSTEHTAYAIGKKAEITDTKVQYNGVKSVITSGIDPTKLEGNGDYLASVTTFDFEASEESKLLYTLPAGISKIRVTIWLEGQDVDCNNDVSQGKLEVDFNFQIPAPANA